MHGRIESPNTSPQAVELDPSYFKQAHSNRPGTGPGYENTKPWMYFGSTPRSINNSSSEKRGCRFRQGCLKDSALPVHTGF